MMNMMILMIDENIDVDGNDIDDDANDEDLYGCNDV
jgi:hypothetical protein